LFFTHAELFKDKISKVDNLKDFKYKDFSYKDGKDYEKGIEFIQNLFKNILNDDKREINFFIINNTTDKKEILILLKNLGVKKNMLEIQDTKDN
jgi:hypothetical protein